MFDFHGLFDRDATRGARGAILLLPPAMSPMEPTMAARNKTLPNTPPSPPCAPAARARSRWPAATSTASCAASTCTPTSSSARWTVASASATWSSAGTRPTCCYDNTTVTGWQHGFPDALARLDLGTRAPRALGRRRALLPGRVRQCRRHALRGVPAPDAEARAQARRKAGRAADGRHGIRVVQLQGNPRQLGRQEGRRSAEPDAGHVRLLAAAHESRTASSSMR